MSTSLQLLDQALELGAKELAHLANGEVEEAEVLFRSRNGMIRKAVENLDTGDMDTLRDKLRELQALQGRLTGEARKLHSSIRDEFQQTKKESKRMAGYHKAAKPARPYSAYISKQG